MEPRPADTPNPEESAAATETPSPPSRDESHWAKQVGRLEAGEVPSEALNLNVTGRRVMSPIQGFGQMWQKTYKVSLGDARVSPEEVISTWKQNFPKFWPDRNLFYGPITGIAPGEVAVLNLTMPGGLKLSTGVLVLYADDDSFTLMTPQGHMFSGWITFSSHRSAEETIAQAQVLMRANDPIFELGLMLGGHKKEDLFWEHTLTALAAHFGVRADVDTQVVRVDSRRQWRNWRNVWHNSAIRSAIYMMTAPFRWLARPFRRRS